MAISRLLVSPIAPCATNQSPILTMDTNGCAICRSYVDVLEIENLHISGCVDSPIAIYGANEFHLRHSIIANNTATASGGMYGEFSGPMFFEDVTFANNTAETEGGGLYLWAVDELTMTDCVIHGNVVGSKRKPVSSVAHWRVSSCDFSMLTHHCHFHMPPHPRKDTVLCKILKRDVRISCKWVGGCTVFKDASDAYLVLLRILRLLSRCPVCDGIWA